METKFNVFEILEIAEKVEQRGAKFYLGAAQLFSQEELKNFLYALAQRKVHLKNTWVKMRKDFSDRTGEFGTFDPDNYVLSNPEVMAGLTWVGTRAGRSRQLTGQENKEEILRDAMHRENAVMTFYQGLRDFARDPAGRETIDTLVKKVNQMVLELMHELEG